MEKTPFIQQKIAQIREKLAKPCTEFETGGFRPTGERSESWIGRVFLCKTDEAKPITDNNGKPLYPLAQFYLPNLPFIPEELKHISWITVFMGDDFPEIEGEKMFPVKDKNGNIIDWNTVSKLGKNGDGWLIREYTANDELAEYEFEKQSFPKPFALQAVYQPEDYPMWDGGGIPSDIFDEILKYKPAYPNKPNENQLDYFKDIYKAHSYRHKFGGYPSFCQPGISFGEGFEFMFQISSDEKAEFNVIDGGSLMFARNLKGEWVLYYDFY